MPDRVTDADLTRWLALAEKATPGPWTLFHRDAANPRNTLLADTGMDDLMGWEIPEIPEPSRGQFANRWDAALCAEARAAVPALVAEVRRLREENRDLRDVALVFERLQPYIDQARVAADAVPLEEAVRRHGITQADLDGPEDDHGTKG